jgi:peptidylprolyl isomerase domain and WD repeat-containing protein 1
MHRDLVTQVVVSAKHDFVITSSQDGYVKFWRKVVQSIEFVKAFRAHLQAITSVALADNEERYATCSA